MDIEGKGAIISGGAPASARPPPAACRGRRQRADRRPQRGEGRRARRRARGARGFVPANVSDEASVQNAVDTAVEAGEGGLRIAVGCAGIGGRSGSPASGPAPAGPLQQRLQVNLVGMFNLMRLAAER